MLNERQAIAAFLPHGESMCLVDAIESCDKTGILCVMRTSQQNDNVFWSAARPSVILLVEFAAQAAAIHGAIAEFTIDAGGYSPQLLTDTLAERANNKPDMQAVKYIGGLKKLEFFEHNLPPHPVDIKADVQCEHSDASGAIYRFELSLQDFLLCSGRMILVSKK